MRHHPSVSDVFWPAALTCLLVAAAILRFHNIAADSIWLDEATSWTRIKLPFPEMIAATASSEQLPLHNVILLATVRLFGDSEVALRAPSAVLGVLNIAAIYWVGTIAGGRGAGGRGVGLVAAIFLTFSSFHVWYSQEARPYALLALTSTLFMGATLRALADGTRAWNGAAVAAAILLLYSHAYGLFLWLSVVVGVAAALLLWRDSAASGRRWLLWQAIAPVVFLPWAVILFFRYTAIVEHGFWIKRPGPGFVVKFAKDMLSGSEMAQVLLVGAILAFVRFTDARLTSLRAWIDRERLLLLAWMFGPVLIGLILSWISRPILIERYVIGSLPAMYVVASLGYWRLLGRLPYVLVAAATLCAVLAFWNAGDAGVRPDWRSLVATYGAELSPSDCVVLYSSKMANPFDYYWRRPVSCIVKVGRTEEMDWGKLGSTSRG